MACAVPDTGTCVPNSSVLAFQFKNCKLMDQKNIVKCVEHRRTLHAIFEDEHGDLPKGSDLRIECTVGTDICTQIDRMKNLK